VSLLGVQSGTDTGGETKWRDVRHTDWSGQSRPLLRHRRANELFEDLVAVAERALDRQAQGPDR
jgi:hypothetical protein